MKEQAGKQNQQTHDNRRAALYSRQHDDVDINHQLDSQLSHFSIT